MFTEEMKNKSVEDVPDYTLRKKYTKRPSHVIKLQLAKPCPQLKLPEDDSRRMWALTDDTLVVIKTWQFGPLPRIGHLFKGIPFESISVEFNIGPHEKDCETLEEIAAFQSDSFSLEFREHWAGLHPNESKVYKDFHLRQQKQHAKATQQQQEEEQQKQQKQQEQQPQNTYSDKFLEPFLLNKIAKDKVKILTGKISLDYLKELPLLLNLKFLGLRVNYEEYQCFAECVPNFQSLERIHLLPQWKFNKQLTITPIK